MQQLATENNLREKNRIYEHTSDPVWQLCVYQPIHGGWEFTNIGGRVILDFIGRAGKLNADSRVVEFCCGSGDTCLYLATKFNCKVIGIDRNKHQILRAKQKVREYPGLRRRVHFTTGDVGLWRASRNHHVAYSLDSLMLVKDFEVVLQNAYQCLHKGGLLVLAEVVAGTRLSHPVRKRVWDLDGIVNLPTPEEYRRLLTEIGFKHVVIRDLTPLARNCFNRIVLNCLKKQTQLKEALGNTGYRNWVEGNRFYASCFKDNKLGYIRITAKR